MSTAEADDYHDAHYPIVVCELPGGGFVGPAVDIQHLYDAVDQADYCNERDYTAERDHPRRIALVRDTIGGKAAFKLVTYLSSGEQYLEYFIHQCHELVRGEVLAVNVNAEEARVLHETLLGAPMPDCNNWRRAVVEDLE